VFGSTLLGACANLGVNRNSPPVYHPPTIDRAVTQAALLASYLEVLQRLVQGAPAEQAEILSTQMTRLTAPAKTNAENERFAIHLFNQQNSLFVFLKFTGIDATNYQSEQAIRPATVNRKVWGGNRTDAGARAQSVLMSVLRTAAQRGIDALTFISETLKANPATAPHSSPRADDSPPIEQTIAAPFTPNRRPNTAGAVNNYSCS